jgi:hypothetical protein
MEVSGQLHAPAALPPGKEPLVDMKFEYNILVGKPEDERPFCKPRRRWEDIRMDVREVGWDGVDKIHVA